MPAVDILISNHNGREALELCIESIAQYTPEPHRVIVYDDASSNPGELEYLYSAQASGWVEKVIVNSKHHGHGYALNELVGMCAANETSYAALIDNDIQILRSGWLSELIALAANPSVLIVATENPLFGFCSRGYMPGQFLPWFALLNMTAYRDGMQVDWSIDELNRNDEPWRTECAALYPPETNLMYHKTRATWGTCAIDFNPNKVIFDPGCVLWCKMRHDNPKRYIHRELTPRILSSFRHWGHAQSWLEPDNEKTEKGRTMKQAIRGELQKLRCGRPL